MQADRCRGQASGGRIRAKPPMSKHRIATHKFSPEGSVLLVIDMQRFFLDPASHAYIPGSNAAVKNAQKLVAKYRQRSLPIIFTRHALLRDEDPGVMGRWWGDVLRDDDDLSEIVPALAPLKGEQVLRKSRYSAFVGTNLEGILRRKRAQRILITGVATHLCCETTARDAFMRDFDVFFVVDATASKSEDLHLAALRTLADGFAIPVTTEEVLRWMR